MTSELTSSLDSELTHSITEIAKSEKDSDHLQKPLSEYVRLALNNYFSQLDGSEPAGLYDMVIKQVEIPLLQAVLRYTHGNQCKTAAILGISRGTLRKKLKLYHLE